jgi:hypothetical protein
MVYDYSKPEKAVSYFGRRVEEFAKARARLAVKEKGRS